jgi:hypothetical protein
MTNQSSALPNEGIVHYLFSETVLNLIEKGTLPDYTMNVEVAEDGDSAKIPIAIKVIGAEKPNDWFITGMVNETMIQIKYSPKTQKSMYSIVAEPQLVSA